MNKTNDNTNKAQKSDKKLMSTEALMQQKKNHLS